MPTDREPCPVLDESLATDPTLGGMLYDDGEPTGHKLRGESERRALRKREHRDAGGCERCATMVPLSVLRVWIEEHREINTAMYHAASERVEYGRVHGHAMTLDSLSSFLDGLTATGGER